MSSFYPTGAGDVVREIFELRRLMQPNPKTDALIALGFLLYGKESATYETVERTLHLAHKHEDGADLYTLDVEEKSVITAKFTAYFEGGKYVIEKYVRGAWEADLDFWYRRDREQNKKLLTAGAA